MTEPHIDIDPEAILIRTRIGTSRWHIIDAERTLTWCDLFLSRGSEHRSLSETPEDRRCETCMRRFREDIIRHPVF